LFAKRKDDLLRIRQAYAPSFDNYMEAAIKILPDSRLGNASSSETIAPARANLLKALAVWARESQIPFYL